jgi:hypothetical protein
MRPVFIDDADRISYASISKPHPFHFWPWLCARRLLRSPSFWSRRDRVRRTAEGARSGKHERRIGGRRPAGYSKRRARQSLRYDTVPVRYLGLSSREWTQRLPNFSLTRGKNPAGQMRRCGKFTVAASSLRFVPHLVDSSLLVLSPQSPHQMRQDARCQTTVRFAWSTSSAPTRLISL